MKSKEFAKKLNLKKETVADLQDKEMNQVQGGAITDLTPCLTESRCTTRCASSPCC